MAFLRIFIGDTLLEQRELLSDRTTIGRTDDNDIVLKGSGVSKHHAVIERRDDSFVLIDDASINGSFIGGKRVKRHTLNYWDEIQIFNYVLKFMAVARARGEESGAPNWSGGRQEQEHTMELDITSLGDLTRLKRRINVPSLTLLGPGEIRKRFPLDRVNFNIGKARDCDIHLAGLLAPRLAARIQRRNDGFYIHPGRRGRVSLNGQRVTQSIRLSDGDALLVRGLSLQFLFRPDDQGDGGR